MSPINSLSSTGSPSPVASTSYLPATPIKEVKLDSSPRKRKALSPREDFDMEDDLDEPLPSKSSTCSGSGRKKPTDEERRSRLEARQARNRQSAQNSRERKKVYMEQLEASVATIKAENDALRAEKAQDQAVKVSLENKVREFESRVYALEGLVRELLKVGGHSRITSLIAAMPTTTAPTSVSEATSFPATYTPKDAQQCSLTTIAAPVTTASNQILATSSTSSLLNQDTRLLAAEATCFDAPSLSRGAELKQSQQRGLGSAVATNGSSIGGESVIQGQLGGIMACQEVASTQQQAVASQSVTSAHDGEMEQLDISSFIDLHKLGGADGHTSTQDQASSATPTPGKASASLPGQIDGTAASSLATNTLLEEILSGDASPEQTVTVNSNFQLLTSTFTSTTKSAEEMAMDAFLAEIYGKQQPEAETSRDLMDNSWISQPSNSESESGGSPPFDLVDLDVEIEQPISSRAPAQGDGVVDWQRFLASITA